MKRTEKCLAIELKLNKKLDKLTLLAANSQSTYQHQGWVQFKNISIVWKISDLLNDYLSSDHLLKYAERVSRNSLMSSNNTLLRSVIVLIACGKKRRKRRRRRKTLGRRRNGFFDFLQFSYSFLIN